MLPPPEVVRVDGEDGPAAAVRDLGAAAALALQVLEARRYKDAAGLWHISNVDAAWMLRAFRRSRG